MDIRIYNELPKDAALIRVEVFVEEQGFKLEFDELDRDATHLVGYLDNLAVATARILQRPDGFVIGRIAVRKSFRKQGLGAMMISAAEDFIAKQSKNTIYINAQRQAVAFYEKQGYLPTGEVDREEDCEHWMMKKVL